MLQAAYRLRISETFPDLGRSPTITGALTDEQARNLLQHQPLGTAPELGLTLPTRSAHRGFNQPYRLGIVRQMQVRGCPSFSPTTLDERIR
jgi:hypothetical protein